MIYKLVVPGPIEDVEEVRVLEWHRQEGTSVEPGELLVELETHKAVVEVRPAQKAFLRNIICREGDWQSIGSSLAFLSDTADEPQATVPEDEVWVLPVEFEIT